MGVNTGITSSRRGASDGMELIVPRIKATMDQWMIVRRAGTVEKIHRMTISPPGVNQFPSGVRHESACQPPCRRLARRRPTRDRYERAILLFTRDPCGHDTAERHWDGGRP
jgi:hypothetical protein